MDEGRYDIVNAERAYNVTRQVLHARERELHELKRQHNILLTLLCHLMRRHYPRSEVHVSSMEWSQATAHNQAGSALSQGMNPMTGELSFQVINVPASEVQPNPYG